ncbi:MAG: LPS export ABC transporter permease LptG [Deltaproteobacteria bacterium]|nr:MAG: LPS export ABC transporter permease LptG [Deltaproteobacteria bacterium]
MRVISRYISRELTKIIAICLGAFAAIYLVIDFFEKIDDFLEARVPIFLALQYFVLKIPLIIQQGVPMAVLMGTLITLGLSARNNELTALKASGVSPILFAGPIVMVALMLSLMDFVMSEYVVPLTSGQANHIWKSEVKHRSSPGGFTQESLWYKSGRVLYNIRVFHPKRKMLEGVTIYFFDSTFGLVKRLDARRGEWDGEAWVLTDGILLQRGTEGNFTMVRFQRRRLELEERPENFQHLERAPEEMTVAELGRYVDKIQSEGYNATRYRVDFHAKIAFPFISVIMALLGIGVALYQGKRGGIAVGVAASVALAFVYILVFQLVLSLGYAGRLQPILAAWASNIFFGVVALFLLAHARH